MTTEIKKTVADKMDTATEFLGKELAGIRTGRASLALLDPIKVDFYGNPSPLKQVAGLSIPDARTITIQPWDPTIIQEIEKAILSSDLGLTPNNDGKLIRISIPPLTEERRHDLVKVAKKLGEDAKVTIRGIRRDGNDELKKAHKADSISEDQTRKDQEEIQNITDQHIKRIDGIIQKKEVEILDKAG